MNLYKPWLYKTPNLAGVISWRTSTYPLERYIDSVGLKLSCWCLFPTDKARGCEFVDVRKFQQTPGIDRDTPKIQIWKDFLQKQVVEDLVYVPGLRWNYP